jgi:hypothetical protein
VSSQAKPWVKKEAGLAKLRSMTTFYAKQDSERPEPPNWGEMPKRPGLYLVLSHGRDFPQQNMRQRGFAGPKIGPLRYVQTHYAQKLVLCFTNQRDTKRFFPDAALPLGSLDVIEGTLVYGEKCYGDWDVCYVAAEFRKLSKPVSIKKSPSSPRVR